MNIGAWKYPILVAISRVVARIAGEQNIISLVVTGAVLLFLFYCAYRDFHKWWSGRKAQKLLSEVPRASIEALDDRVNSEKTDIGGK